MELFEDSIKDISLEEIEQLKHILNDNYCILKNQLHLIEKRQISLVKDKLKILVGRAFKDEKGNPFYIYDTPQESTTITGHMDFNPYQIPVLIMGSKEDNHITGYSKGELSYDTVFSGVCKEKEEDVLTEFKRQYTEISIEEFRESVIKIIDEVIGRK